MALIALPAYAQSDRGQGRSMVISQFGIVAAENPLAAQAGVSILEHGGSAVDAAIAANAVMGVVEPMIDVYKRQPREWCYKAKSDHIFPEGRKVC